MTDSARGRILVAGIGNVLRGDDGFGVEVVRRLAGRKLGALADLLEVGVRGLDLGYRLLERPLATLLIDIVRRGGAPGTLYVIAPDGAQSESTAGSGSQLDAHSLGPASVLAWARAHGGDPGELRLIGCEPQPFDEDEVCMGLSAVVEAAVEPAMRLVAQLVREFEVERA